MPASESSPLHRILGQYRELLHRIETPDAKRIEDLVGALDQSGRWPDIDYADQKQSEWNPWDHARRLRELSLALASGGAGGPAEAELEEAIGRALNHWLEHRYRSPNWWHNQIGIPRAMRDTAVLLEERLDPARRAGLLEVIAQYGKVRATGANLLWLGEIALHYGCLTGDVERVADAAERMRGEIVVGNPEGIQSDWSFFQHGARLQSFAYGRAYTEIAVSLGWQLRGTPWEYSRDEIAVLSNLLLEGMQWMMRGAFTVPSTMDRSASRPGNLKIGLLPYVELWSEVDSDRRADLETFAGRLAGRAEPLEGFRHFERGDFSVYHRPGFSFFLKTISDRTFPTESINSENLLGKHLNGGNQYLMRDGNEYFDLMPVWDWDRLPGIASADGFDELNRQAFTGGIGDEASGFAVMDTSRRNPENGATLAVRRSWFFHGDTVIGLHGGWDLSDGAATPFVVLDQSRLQGPVAVLDASGNLRPVSPGEYEIDSPLALVHDDAAWFPLRAPSLSLRFGPASGSWQRINLNQSDEPVTEEVFTAAIHYSGPPDAGGFAVMPGVAAGDLRRLARRPPWTILRNDHSVQAVAFDGDVVMAAFYEAAKVESGDRQLSVSKPCLVFCRGGELIASDPAMQGGKVTIKWNETERTVDLQPDGRGRSWK